MWGAWWVQQIIGCENDSSYWVLDHISSDEMSSVQMSNNKYRHPSKHPKFAACYNQIMHKIIPGSRAEF